MTFTDAARALLDEIGFAPPDDYVRDLEALNEACAACFRECNRGPIALGFPELLENGNVYAGNLDTAISAGFCHNEAAKHFIECIDRRTGRRCSIMQMQILIRLQETRWPKENTSIRGQA